jgi:hypothetical protein
MLTNISISVVVFGIIYSVIMIWRYSLSISETIFQKFTGKNTSGSMDVDNLVRFLILIVLVPVIWTPIIYILTLIFD